MRQKPVTRDEVRLDHNFHFCAVPANAFSKDGAAIASLWKPLLKQLRRELKAYVKGPLAEMRARWVELGIGEEGPYDDPPPTMPSASLWRDRAWCRQCDGYFYRLGKYVGRYCSDDCAKEAAKPAFKRKIKRQTAIRAKKRAETRAGRVCPVCGEPVEAARATKRYCSDGCRVAGHRAQTEPH